MVAVALVPSSLSCEIYYSPTQRPDHETIRACLLWGRTGGLEAAHGLSEKGSGLDVVRWKAQPNTNILTPSTRPSQLYLYLGSHLSLELSGNSRAYSRIRCTGAGKQPTDGW
jgi:hypothetical protein